MIVRTYTERQYQKFESKFKKEFPNVCQSLKENGICLSPIIFAFYESKLFNLIME